MAESGVDPGSKVREEDSVRRRSAWWPLLKISLRMVVGRRPWLALLVILLWPGFQALRMAMGWQETAFSASSVQTTLIGFPLMILAIGLGVRIIAAELENRTLEISYTIPGGAARAWTAKLLAAAGLLLACELLLSLCCETLFLPVGLSAFYGAFQESIFYLVVGMALAVWSRSQITGLMLSTLVFVMNFFLTGFGSHPMRVSPTFNPMALRHLSPQDVLAFTVQNRIGMALLIVAIVSLSFSRAQRRERMLR